MIKILAGLEKFIVSTYENISVLIALSYISLMLCIL